MTLTKKYYTESLGKMIESCFAYGGYGIGTYNYNRYILPYKEHLGEKLFNKTYKAKCKELEGCTIKYNVYEDSEGCTYNSIIKPD